MRWKRALNRGLTRATGHHLVPADASPSPRRRRKSLPRHYDAEARQIIREVRPRTMTAHEKLFALICATRHIVEHRLPGAIVECGVWRGGSMQAVARTLLALDAADRDLHLFDTFEGMPPPTAEDRRHDGVAAADLLAASGKASKVWAVATLDDVVAGMRGTGYPPDRIHYHRGRVEETIPGQAPASIALLRLDTDWYRSTRHELDHLYDRLVPGGVLILDDYGYWEGARRATDEFLRERAASLFLVPVASGRIAVKP